MAATAGVLTAIGRQTGRTYSVDVYIPDAIATSLTFNPAGLAGTGSLATWRPPENVIITDISLATAPTAVGATFLVDGAPVAGGTVRWANMLTSAISKPKLYIPIRAGALLGALQF